MPKQSWFGLFPFRSPLLRESLFVFSSSRYLDVSVPWVYFTPKRDSRSSAGRVSPFGNPRIKQLFAPSRGLSQLITSFIVFESQGIHRTPLFTFFNKFYKLKNQLLFQHVKELLPIIRDRKNKRNRTAFFPGNKCGTALPMS